MICYYPIYYAIVNEEAMIVREIFEDDQEASLYAKKLNEIDHVDHYQVQPCQIVPRGYKSL